MRCDTDTGVNVALVSKRTGVSVTPTLVNPSTCELARYLYSDSALPPNALTHWLNRENGMDDTTWQWMNEVSEYEIANEQAMAEIMTEQEYEEAR